MNLVQKSYARMQELTRLADVQVSNLFKTISQEGLKKDFGILDENAETLETGEQYEIQTYIQKLQSAIQNLIESYTNGNVSINESKDLLGKYNEMSLYLNTKVKYGSLSIREQNIINGEIDNIVPLVQELQFLAERLDLSYASVYKQLYENLKMYKYVPITLTAETKQKLINKTRESYNIDEAKRRLKTISELHNALKDLGIDEEIEYIDEMNEKIREWEISNFRDRKKLGYEINEELPNMEETINELKEIYETQLRELKQAELIASSERKKELRRKMKEAVLERARIEKEQELMKKRLVEELSARNAEREARLKEEKRLSDIEKLTEKNMNKRKKEAMQETIDTLQQRVQERKKDKVKSDKISEILNLRNALVNRYNEIIDNWSTARYVMTTYGKPSKQGKSKAVKDQIDKEVDETNTLNAEIAEYDKQLDNLGYGDEEAPALEEDGEEMPALEEDEEDEEDVDGEGKPEKKVRKQSKAQLAWSKKVQSYMKTHNCNLKTALQKLKKK